MPKRVVQIFLGKEYVFTCVCWSLEEGGQQEIKIKS